MNIQSILFTPIYSRFELDQFSNDELTLLFNQSSDVIFDCYCPKCNKSSTFLPKEDKEDDRFRMIQLSLGTMNNKRSLKDFLSDLTTIYRTFFCSRNPNDKDHYFTLGFKFEAMGFIKICQYPSIADVTNRTIIKYKDFNKEIYKELNRGNGLISHGIGVGSFVYLRRILEQFIVRPKLEEKLKNQLISKEDLGRLDFKGKLKFLRNEIPDFLTSNTILYSIISKGIHELSEEECLRIYPVVLNAIEIILDEEIEIINRNKKMEEISKQLNSI